MRCDSQASLLAHALASPCFGHEPKTMVMIIDPVFIEELEEDETME
jgi:hypothetical protein